MKRHRIRTATLIAGALSGLVLGLAGCGSDAQRPDYREVER